MKLLVTVAHPDDETFGLGSVLAHAHAAGWASVVACATRGELGEVPPHAMDGLLDDGGCIDPTWLAERREAELRAATALLGVERVDVFDWIDSGVDGTPAPGSLAGAAVGDVAAAIAGIVEDVRPDVVIMADGLDGHRDHVAVRDATLAALARTTWRPARTYLWCLPRSLLGRYTGNPDIGTPDESITTVVDTRDLLDLRWKAIRAHASQTPPFQRMDAATQRAFLTVDYLRRVDPPWSGGPLETDWCIPSTDQR
jgi:N-acetyl-1-D-myo-inositol-2-amino-2-deoxy-alpha-D-glucopyranoside deacetylase